MAITEQILTGSAVDDCLNDIASLRIEIFREFPYLYDGRREDELHYLKLYSVTPDSFVIIVKEGEKVAGAATGMPLRHETTELVEPFNGTSYPVDEIFYVGELLFYPEHRNRGMGMQVVRMVEEHVRSYSTYRYLTCATVVRPDNHPLRPSDYIPIDRFLAHTGFNLLPGITMSFTWLETDGVRRSHPMNFWIKELQV
ncbi:MAG: GNAT family N-acetyltransferase [Geobacteraceae bacterium]|nr:GNAT family N-acetyltransferase [Geobacteraceae bacterium]NTW79303.1 GNAT family N-acetyltransferase [Geobacteraceae bacterium]